MPDLTNIELREYLNIALRWWWLLIILPVVAAATGYWYSSRQPTFYQASTTIIVGQAIIQSAAPTSGDFALTERLAQTYADMATRQPVLEGVVDSLGLNVSWRALKDVVRARPVPGTQLLEVTAVTGSPEQAQAIADEVAHQLILLSPTNLQSRERSENQRLIDEQIQVLRANISASREKLKTLEEARNGALSAQQLQNIQNEIDKLKSSISGWEANYTQLLISRESKHSPNYLAIIEPAQTAASIGSDTLKDTLLAVIAGLLLAGGIVFLLEYLDNSIKSTFDLQQSLGLTVLGTVGDLNDEAYPNRLVSSQAGFSPELEAYRMIRSQVQFKAVTTPVKSMLVTSPMPGEGKSLTAANLGIVMAQAGLKTIIIDTDLRQPVLHQVFKVSNQTGLTDLLRSETADPADCLIKTKVDNLLLLTSGILPFNPPELLGSLRMQQLMLRLDELADIVIYDSPPIVVVTDAAILSSRVDGVVLVAMAEQTQRAAAQQALATLQQAQANILGAVLNQAQQKRSGYPYYYRKSHYTPGSPPPASPPPQSGPKRRWQWLPFIK